MENTTYRKQLDILCNICEAENIVLVYGKFDLWECTYGFECNHCKSRWGSYKISSDLLKNKKIEELIDIRLIRTKPIRNSTLSEYQDRPGYSGII